MINTIGCGESKDVRDKVTLVVIFASGQGMCGGREHHRRPLPPIPRKSRLSAGAQPQLNLGHDPESVSRDHWLNVISPITQTGFAQGLVPYLHSTLDRIGN